MFPVFVLACMYMYMCVCMCRGPARKTPSVRHVAKLLQIVLVTMDTLTWSCQYFMLDTSKAL